jgi:hypothetical protein
MRRDYLWMHSSLEDTGIARYSGIVFRCGEQNLGVSKKRRYTFG